MLLAVPAMIFTAASISFAFKSGSFAFAMSSNCALVNFPTFSLLGSPLPFWIFRAFLIKTAAGGVYTTKSNDLSSYTFITTGSGMPFSDSWVAELNALQKSIILSPTWPKAGPTGGLGFAPPAGICNFNTLTTFQWNLNFHNENIPQNSKWKWKPPGKNITH